MRMKTAFAALPIGVGALLAGMIPLHSTASTASTTAAPAHLVIIMMENHGLSAVTTDPTDMPYLNSLWNGGGERLTNYFAVSHPSWPNYAAMFSGLTEGSTDLVTAGQFADPVLWDQLTAANVSWGVYQEGMPSPCYAGATFDDSTGTNGRYKLPHNPAVPFASVYNNTNGECQANVLPLSSLNTAQLPQVSFIAPNLCDDMHGLTSAQVAQYGYANCITGTAALEQRSDNWLNSEVTALTGAGATVLVAFDEAGGTAGANGTPGGGQVYAVLTGAGITPGTSWSTATNHYGVLRAIEDAYGLPELANAQQFAAIPLRSDPLVNITAPSNGAVVSGSLTVAGTADAGTVGTVGPVEVSVDNGVAQAATGTDSWSALIDTTQLPNGTHTINVTATDSAGGTGTASEVVTVANNAATSCPATTTGSTELSGDVSVEVGQAGWTGAYNTSSSISRVEPPGGSYDGLWALQLAPKSGLSGPAGVNNANPLWVPGSPGTSTTGAHIYVASAFLQASAPGEQVSLLVKETTPAGALIGHHTSTLTLSDTGWHQLTSSIRATTTGDAIRYSLYGTNFANSGQHLLADCLSLQTHG